jgi:hypothetical protein
MGLWLCKTRRMQRQYPPTSVTFSTLHIVIKSLLRVEVVIRISLFGRGKLRRVKTKRRRLLLNGSTQTKVCKHSGPVIQIADPVRFKLKLKPRRPLRRAVFRARNDHISYVLILQSSVSIVEVYDSNPLLLVV